MGKLRKYGIIFLVLLMVLATVFASGALAADVATSADLAEALIAGGEIKLTGDITTTGLFRVQKDAMIDLNGHKITREMDVADAATPVFYVTEGTLAVDDTVGGGEIVSKNNAGTAEAIRVYAGDASKKTNAILNKVKLSSDGFGVVIMGNSEAGETAEKVSFLASVIINSSAEVYGTSTGVLLEGKGATLEVNGATIKSGAFAISGNGTWKGDKNKGGTSITITSGKIESEKDLAIYHPQDGTLNISGGTITGTDGIQLKAGGAITNISGGTIKATGDFVAVGSLDDDSNGSVATGSAISLIGNSGYAGNISLNISGAGVEIISEKGYAVRQEITKGEASQVSSVKISAGTIKGAEGALYFGNYDKGTYSVTGGSYSSDPSAYVAEPYIVKQSGDTFTVGQIEDEVTVSPAKLELTVGKSSKVTATSDKMDTITWETSDSDVATVSDGTVTAAKTGIAIITAKGRKHSASCVVSVIDPDKPASTPTPEPVSPGTVDEDKNPVNNDKDKPANVEATGSTVFAATESTKESVAGEIKFDKEDLIANAEGDLTVSPILVKSAVEYVKSADSTVTPTSITVLPIVQAEVEKEGNVAAIALTLTGPELGAQSNSVAGDINLIKVFADGTGEKFGYVSAAADYADKTFTLKDADGKNLAPTDKVATDSVYTLILFVADNGDFDLDATAGSVIDPVAVATNAATEPKSGGSSSGCNGGFGALALLAFAVLPFIRREKR